MSQLLAASGASDETVETAKHLFEAEIYLDELDPKAVQVEPSTESMVTLRFGGR